MVWMGTLVVNIQQVWKYHDDQWSRAKLLIAMLNNPQCKRGKNYLIDILNMNQENYYCNLITKPNLWFDARLDTDWKLICMFIGWGVEPRTTPPPSQGEFCVRKRETMTQKREGKILYFITCPIEGLYNVTVTFLYTCK